MFWILSLCLRLTCSRSDCFLTSHMPFFCLESKTSTTSPTMKNTRVSLSSYARITSYIRINRSWQQPNHINVIRFVEPDYPFQGMWGLVSPVNSACWGAVKPDIDVCSLGCSVHLDAEQHEGLAGNCMLVGRAGNTMQAHVSLC